MLVTEVWGSHQHGLRCGELWCEGATCKGTEFRRQRHKHGLG